MFKTSAPDIKACQDAWLDNPYDALTQTACQHVTPGESAEFYHGFISGLDLAQKLQKELLGDKRAFDAAIGACAVEAANLIGSAKLSP